MLRLTLSAAHFVHFGIPGMAQPKSQNLRALSQDLRYSCIFLFFFISVVEYSFAGCTGGPRYIRYNDEVGFTSAKTDVILTDGVDISMKTDYDAAVVTGSIHVPADGTYDVRLRTTGSTCSASQWWFNDIRVNSDMCAGGMCLSAKTFYKTVSGKFLSSHAYYPFKIEFRSGCGLYTHGFSLEYKLSSSSTWVKIPGSMLASMCTDLGTVSCDDSYYGVDCTKRCVASEDCKAHGMCSETGECVCELGWHQSPDCSTFIPPTCTGHPTLVRYGDEVSFKSEQERRDLTVVDFSEGGSAHPWYAMCVRLF